NRIRFGRGDHCRDPERSALGPRPRCEGHEGSRGSRRRNRAQRRRVMRLFNLILAIAVARAAAPEYGYQIVHVYPHDHNAFTQGLEFCGGFLYESTGLEGRSSVRKVKLETGEVLQKIDIPAPIFGEGITVINQQIVELTWKHQLGFVYDQPSFRR